LSSGDLAGLRQPGFKISSRPARRDAFFKSAQATWRRREKQGRD